MAVNAAATSISVILVSFVIHADISLFLAGSRTRSMLQHANTRFRVIPVCAQNNPLEFNAHTSSSVTFKAKPEEFISFRDIYSGTSKIRLMGL